MRPASPAKPPRTCPRRSRPDEAIHRGYVGELDGEEGGRVAVDDQQRHHHRQGGEPPRRECAQGARGAQEWFVEAVVESERRELRDREEGIRGLAEPRNDAERPGEREQARLLRAPPRPAMNVPR